MQTDGLILFILAGFSSLWYLPSAQPYTGLQSPVACHLLAMFGTGACNSCWSSLGTLLTSHFDEPDIKTALSGGSTSIRCIVLPLELISVLKVFFAESIHLGVFPKRCYFKWFSVSVYCQLSIWIKTEQSFDVCFSNASLCISFRAQQKSNLYRSSRQQKKLQSICQVEPKSNLFVLWYKAPIYKAY